MEDNIATLQQTVAWNEAEAATLPQARLGRIFSRYLLILLLVPVLLWPTAFWVVTRPGYERWSTSKWGPSLEYAFNMRDLHPQKADLVIFGDSSAFLGIDPRLIKTQLGLDAVVFPATVGSLPVVGDAPLQMYLAHHPPPKVIVLYFTAWDLDFNHTAKIGLFEGEEMLLRHGSLQAVLAFARHHPSEFFKFPFRFYSSFTPFNLVESFSERNRLHSTADALGHVDYVEVRPPLEPSCEIPAEYLAQTSADSVEALARRYRTPQTRVLVYLAPVPGCKNAGAVAQRSTPQLGAAPPAVLSADFFATDPYYAHIRPNHVARNTALFSGVLRAYLQRARP